MQIVQFAGYTYKQFPTNNCMLNNSRMLSSEVPSLFRDNLVRFRDSILLFLLFLHSLGLTLPPMVPPDLQRTFHILAESLKIEFRSRHELEIRRIPIAYFLPNVTCRMRSEQTESVLNTDPLSHRRCIVLNTCHKLPQVTCSPRVVSCSRHDLIDRHQHVISFIDLNSRAYVPASLQHRPPFQVSWSKLCRRGHC